MRSLPLVLLLAACASAPSRPLAVRALPVLRTDAITEIQLGGHAGCALTAEGAVWCFTGRDIFAIEGLPPVTRLTLGAGEACALTASGEAWCWHAEVDPARRRVEPLGLGGIDLVALTSGHGGCARSSTTRTLTCWGPRGGSSVVSSLGAVESLDTYQSRVCALGVDGVLRCVQPDMLHLAPQEARGPDGAIDHASSAHAAWFLGRDGQISYARLSVTRREAQPLQQLPPIAGVVDLVGAAGGACARTGDGRAVCWGEATTTPVDLGLVGVTRLDRAGGLVSDHGISFVCAQASSGTHCFELSDAGPRLDAAVRIELAGMLTRVPTPLGGREVLGGSRCGAGPDGLTVLDVAAGAMHACAVLSDGSARCWGFGHMGQLGAGTSTDHAPRPLLVSGASALASVDAGMYFSCFVDREGAVRCAGSGDRGQLGDGSRRGAREPSPLRLGTPVRSLALGHRHACALTADARVYCWGDTDVGGGVARRARTLETPVEVREVRGASSIAASHRRSAAVVNGRVLEWTGGRAPAALEGVDVPAVQVAVGETALYARLLDGRVIAWRAEGGHSISARPTSIEGLPPANAVVASGERACVLDEAGELWCWGRSRAVPDAGPRPERASWGARLADIAIGDSVECFVEEAGGVCCRGQNAHGELGRPAERDAVLGAAAVVW